MRKRFVSLLLSAAVMLSAFSIPAFAADPDTTENTGAVTVTLPGSEELAAAAEAAKAANQTGSKAEATDTVAETDKTTDVADDEEVSESITYVALGDSIVAGVGLTETTQAAYGASLVGYDASANFKGYPDNCYVALVADKLGLDRDHALNYGLPGLMTGDLLDLLREGKMPQMNMLSGCEYNYPELRESVAKADVISIQLGSNDALVPCIVALGNATNWKSEGLASVALSGVLRTLNADSWSMLRRSLKELNLTTEETNATWKLLTSGMGTICDDAYTSASENLRLIIEEIRKLNPDAQIILLSYTNPVPLLPSWTRFFNNMNSYSENLAKVYGLTYVKIPHTKTALDGHPSVSGHRYIANKIVRATDK